MRFSSAFVLAALPFLLAGAVPVQESRVGITVPLTKRVTLQHADGTANLEAIRSHLEHTTAKMAKGFAAYERNTGKPHSLASSVPVKRAGTGETALEVQGSGELWRGKITVGTPPVEYSVDFDTGSSDLFLPSTKCGQSCAGHKAYDTSASKTATDTGNPFGLSYGDGSNVKGEVWTDAVSIGGLSAKASVGAADTYSDGFSSEKFKADGLMGMGFETISEFKAPPVFQSLVDAKQTAKPIFSFKLSKNGSSELFLGGIDEKVAGGDIGWAPATKEGYWQVNMDGASHKDKEIVGKTDSIIDTGTTLIVTDPDSAAKFYEAIGGKSAGDAGPGMYTIPCDATPEISLKFGGKSFPIAADTFNLGPVSDGSKDCVGGLAGDPSMSFWIIGDVFLQNTYTVFDLGEKRVGFSQLGGSS